MLRFRLRYLLDTKGLTKPYNYLIRLGFSPNVATRLMNNNVNQLKLSQVNLLCKVFNCTPNDLLEYVPSNGEALPENHPLLTLVRNDKSFNIIGQINHLSFDQLKEVEQFISSIKKGKEQEG